MTDIKVFSIFKFDCIGLTHIRLLLKNYLEFQTEEEREWFAKNFEACFYEPLNDETRRAIAREMLRSQAFDKFLAVKFVSLKRYGGEGAESMMAFFYELFKLSASGLYFDHVQIEL